MLTPGYGHSLRAGIIPGKGSSASQAAHLSHGRFSSTDPIMNQHERREDHTHLLAERTAVRTRHLEDDASAKIEKHIRSQRRLLSGCPGVSCRSLGTAQVAGMGGTMATSSFFSQALFFLSVFCACNLKRIKSHAKVELCNAGLWGGRTRRLVLFPSVS